MKKITLDAESRTRLARQIAESTGVQINCNGSQAVLPADQRDHFRV